MSDAVFPVLPGMTWDIVKKPIWSTIIQTSVSGKELRGTYWTYPRWEFNLAYDLLRAGTEQELQTLLGFFLERQGSFDTFLYLDPSDNIVVGQRVGVGDASTVNFQLVRTLGGFVEPIKSPLSVPTIYFDGVKQSSGWSGGDLTSSGLVTFATAPGSGVVITADFSYYFRCRFIDDVEEFNNFMYQLWELKKLAFISVK